MGAVRFVHHLANAFGVGSVFFAYRSSTKCHNGRHRSTIDDLYHDLSDVDDIDHAEVDDLDHDLSEVDDLDPDLSDVDDLDKIFPT